MKCRAVGIGVLYLLAVVGCATVIPPSNQTPGTAVSDPVPFTISTSNRNLTIAPSSEVESLQDGATSLVSVVLTVGIDRESVFDLMGQPDVVSDDWICSNRLTGGLTLDEAVEILGNDYVVTPTEFKDFVSFDQYGISLEIYYSTDRIEEVNITEFNYD